MMAARLAIRPNSDVPFGVIYEDSDLIVVDKPAGVVTQPGKGHTTDTLLNGLFSRYGKRLQNLGASRDWGLLHRLDKSTSGLLVAALRPRAYDFLRAQFEQRRVEKEYLALVRGRPMPPQGVIQARLKEIMVGVKKVIVSRSGQEAISAYRVIGAGSDVSLVAVSIKTGRLHQIRAHMMFLGHPVLGDDLYDVPEAKPGGSPRARRLCLHCSRLGFQHPTARQWREFKLPLPADLLAIARRFGLSCPP